MISTRDEKIQIRFEWAVRNQIDILIIAGECGAAGTILTSAGKGYLNIRYTLTDEQRHKYLIFFLFLQ